VTVLNWVQLLALIAAALYFGLKVLQGWLIVNVSLSVTTERAALEPHRDGLAVAVTITKGPIGSVRIDDTLVRVAHTGAAPTTERLVGTRRVSLDLKQFRIDSDLSELTKNAIYRLPPGESTTWSCWMPVPSGEVCTIEVVVIGHQRPGRLPAQWRASVISLPKTPSLNSPNRENSM
jgi:hypothetical protein